MLSDWAAWPIPSDTSQGLRTMTSYTASHFFSPSSSILTHFSSITLLLGAVSYVTLPFCEQCTLFRNRKNILLEHATHPTYSPTSSFPPLPILGPHSWIKTPTVPSPHPLTLLHWWTGWCHSLFLHILLLLWRGEQGSLGDGRATRDWLSHPQDGYSGCCV